ncbi:MAG: hypothetical protein ACRDWX_12650 [Acidimicrobiia bacterium]
MGKRWGIVILVAWTVLTGLVAAASPATASKPEAADAKDKVRAVFENGMLDLARGWGEAHACLWWPSASETAECYRTEQEMDLRIVELEQMVSSEGTGLEVGTLAADCSGYLRLYDGTGYTGDVLYLRARLQWLNLANFGFSNRTSSYRIGPCSAYFADLAGGGGDWYPTNLTEAYDQASSMLSGWSNKVSSVYIT